MPLTYPSPLLTGPQVHLRRWSLDDLGCVAAAGTDPEIPQGTTVPAVYTDEAGKAFIERQWSRNDDGMALALAIARNSDDRAVGQVFLGLTRVARQCRLGYWLVPDARRVGYGSEAVDLVSRWVLTEPSADVHRLVAEVHPDNQASIRLLERCGFTLEGTLRSWLWIGDEVHDASQYSLVRSDIEDENA